jgi:hypothetical protein
MSEIRLLFKNFMIEIVRFITVMTDNRHAIRQFVNGKASEQPFALETKELPCDKRSLFIQRQVSNEPLLSTTSLSGHDDRFSDSIMRRKHCLYLS